MLESGVIVDHDDFPLYWHSPVGRTMASLPDSPVLWNEIWRYFKERLLKGFAHSHPGSGIPVPSSTDISTFVAIESALGATLDWWITSKDHVVLLRRITPGIHSTPGFQHAYLSTTIEAPMWVEELRRRSETNKRVNP